MVRQYSYAYESVREEPDCKSTFLSESEQEFTFDELVH